MPACRKINSCWVAWSCPSSTRPTPHQGQLSFIFPAFLVALEKRFIKVCRKLMKLFTSKIRSPVPYYSMYIYIRRNRLVLLYVIKLNFITYASNFIASKKFHSLRLWTALFKRIFLAKFLTIGGLSKHKGTGIVNTSSKYVSHFSKYFTWKMWLHASRLH